MKARMLVRILVLVLVGLVLLGEAAQPNFLFVISDDLRLFDPADDPFSVMPRLNTFVKSGTANKAGVFFSNAHTQMAMCSPSRCSFLSGLRPDTTGLYDINQNLRKAKVRITTLPQALKSKGYTTIAVGKVFDGRSSGGPGTQDYPLSWSIRPFSLKGEAWNRNVSMPDCGYGDTRYNPKTNPRPFSQCVSVPNPSKTSGFIGNGLPDLDILDTALEKLDELAANPAQPWFLAVGFLRPHLPYVALSTHFARWPRSDFFNNTQYQYYTTLDDVYPLGAYNNDEPKSYSDWPIGTNPTSLRIPIAYHARAVHSYLASSSQVDEYFGRLVDALESKPASVRDNTYVFFFGDHGYMLGEHEFYGKKTIYEKCTKIPLLMLGPKTNFPSMRTVSSPVELLDLAPTILELAGITSTAVQGTSLIPYTTGTVRTKAVALSQFNGFGSTKKYLMNYGFKGNRYRMVFHYNRVKKVVLRTELYDYVTDPFELHDVSRLPQYLDTVKNFYTLFNVYRQSISNYNAEISTTYLNLDI